jgi:hypothetical protein
MTKVIFGNHSSVMVPRQDRDSIRKFYCDVLGGKITKADPERDFLRLGEDFYIAFLYGDVPDASEFLRSARSVWLEIKSDNVEEMSRKILESGLVRKLDVPNVNTHRSLTPLMSNKSAAYRADRRRNPAPINREPCPVAFDERQRGSRSRVGVRSKSGEFSSLKTCYGTTRSKTPRRQFGGCKARKT